MKSSLILVSLLALFSAMGSDSLAAQQKPRANRKVAPSTKVATADAHSTGDDAADVQSSFNGLGSNEAIIQRARAMDADSRVSVVQNRLVDRNGRFEIGGNYGLVAGGDSYTRTQNLGAQLDFHISPKWSLGLRYFEVHNDLNDEGKAAYNDYLSGYSSGSSSPIPGLDAQKNATLFVVNWYPIYGKLSLLNSVSHFDLYALAGGGQTTLNSGSTAMYTAGGGIAFWWSQHFDTRIEGRYQTYNDHPFRSASTQGIDMDKSRHIDEAVAQISVGVLL